MVLHVHFRLEWMIVLTKYKDRGRASLDEQGIFKICES